jgi:protease I
MNPMNATLKNRKVAFLAANEGVEQVELTEPWSAIEEAGGDPVLIAPEAGQIQAFDHLDAADKFPVDVTADEARIGEYAGLVLPGGVANPDHLRMDEDSVGFVRDFFAAGKPVAVICHGPWTLIEADVVRNRTITSYPSVKTDIQNAGGNWVDQEVVVCEEGANKLISSRRPHDLPAFIDELIDAFAS